MKYGRKAFSLLMAALLCLSMLPASVLAEEDLVSAEPTETADDIGPAAEPEEETADMDGQASAEGGAEADVVYENKETPEDAAEPEIAVEPSRDGDTEPYPLEGMCGDGVYWTYMEEDKTLVI